MKHSDALSSASRNLQFEVGVGVTEFSGVPAWTPKPAWVHVKTTPAERELWHAKAEEAGLTLADLIRRQLGVKRRRRTHVPVADPALVAALARIGNNLNQLARWANTHKSGAESVQILTALATAERILSSFLPPVLDVGADAECTGEPDLESLDSYDDAH